MYWQYASTVIRPFAEIRYLIFDYQNAYRKDPALRGKVFGILEMTTYAGLWAITFHQFAHVLFVTCVPFLSRLLSQIARFLTGINVG